MIRNCVVCGESFNAIRVSHLCCSKECNTRKQNAKKSAKLKSKRDALPNRTCKFRTCTKVFKPKTSLQRGKSSRMEFSGETASTRGVHHSMLPSKPSASRFIDVLWLLPQTVRAGIISLACPHTPGIHDFLYIGRLHVESFRDVLVTPADSLGREKQFLSQRLLS